MRAVWQSMTGAYPLPISPGWFRTMTRALKVLASLAGSFLESEATFPRRISLTETFLTLKPTLSPGPASGRDSWCISTDLTSVVTLTGAKVTTIPGLIRPVSTRPTGTVPGKCQLPDSPGNVLREIDQRLEAVSKVGKKLDA